MLWEKCRLIWIFPAKCAQVKKKMYLGACLVSMKYLCQNLNIMHMWEMSKKSIRHASLLLTNGASFRVRLCVLQSRAWTWSLHPLPLFGHFALPCFLVTALFSHRPLIYKYETFNLKKKIWLQQSRAILFLIWIFNGFVYIFQNKNCETFAIDFVVRNRAIKLLSFSSQHLSRKQMTGAKKKLKRDNFQG